MQMHLIPKAESFHSSLVSTGFLSLAYTLRALGPSDLPRSAPTIKQKIFCDEENIMRIEIKYRSSEGPHLIDLSAVELDQLRNANEVFVTQSHPATKSLRIEGEPDELELLAVALLNRAIELWRPID